MKTTAQLAFVLALAFAIPAGAAGKALRFPHSMTAFANASTTMPPDGPAIVLPAGGSGGINSSGEIK